MDHFIPDITRSTAQCLAPLDHLEPAIFAIPAGACDTHAHVVAQNPGYPMVEGRSYVHFPPPSYCLWCGYRAATADRDKYIRMHSNEYFRSFKGELRERTNEQGRRSVVE